jgi:hypothetical protein
VRRDQCVPNSPGSSPTLPIHSETKRAYWRVVILVWGPRDARTGTGWVFYCDLLVVNDGLAGLLAQFKSDRPPGFLLSNRCTIGRLAAGATSTLIATTSQPRSRETAKLAVDRQVEPRKATNSVFDLQLRPDLPDAFWSQRRICPFQLAFVPRHALWVRVVTTDPSKGAETGESSDRSSRMSFYPKAR